MRHLSEDAIAGAVKTLLLALGEDPRSEALRGTPVRVARFWKEFLGYDPGNTATTFEAIRTDQMVAVTGVEVWSLCEHHLLPFSSRLSIGYLARDRVVGLSKMARMAHANAHRLQLQERLVEGVAGDLADVLGHDDVAVFGEGEHLCMVMRGIQTPGTMHTSVLRGAFRENPDTRAEFMDLIRRHS